MFEFIEVLRAIATLLIANSHFKGVYPTDMISFGGGFGLALFYMISGYLLANVNQKTQFSSWYLKKVVRLYIPLLLFRVIELATGFIEIDSFQKAFHILVFPATWFGASMVLMYPLYYCFVKWVYSRKSSKAIGCALLVFAAIFVGLFVFKPGIASFSLETLSVQPFSVETPYIITQSIWLSCMLIGLYIRKHGKVLCKKVGINLVVCCLAVVLFLAIRVALKDGEWLLPVSYIGFAYFIFCACMLLEKRIGVVMQTLPGKLVKNISCNSLEIYYVQFIFIAVFKNLVFPLNWICIVGTVLISANILRLVSTAVSSVLLKGRAY